MRTIFKTAYAGDRRGGYTLVEMIVYIALLAIITTALVQSLVAVFRSNRDAFADANLRSAGYSAMEAMTQAIMASKSIDTADSVFAPSAAGTLELDEVDASGNASVVKFALSSGTLLLEKGSTTPAVVGPVTTAGVTVASLEFWPIDTGNSEAVRIALELSATANGATKDEWFYTTAVLRDSY